jgi:hypothetical protein
MDPIEAFMSGEQIVGAASAGGRRVENRGPGNMQRVAAGLPRQAVAAAASADLQINVSEPFRPDRIVLSTAAQALDVTNVKIGTKSLNVTSNPISGNCFSEDAIGTDLQGYTAQPGVGFVISVTNNTAGSITTGGGTFGPGLN